jgi:LuxR family maltose regulon positive regulatory protein
MSRKEAAALIEASDYVLDDAQSAAVLDRSEGWAAGLSLSLLALQAGATQITGDDRYIADYFRAECLTGLSGTQLEFLRRTSVLDELSGPLCNALLGRANSAQLLSALEQSGLFLVPLDRARRT